MKDKIVHGGFSSFQISGTKWLKEVGVGGKTITALRTALWREEQIVQ